MLSLKVANLISIAIYTWLDKAQDSHGCILYCSQEIGPDRSRAPASPSTGADSYGVSWLCDRHTLPRALHKHFWMFSEPSIVRVGSMVRHIDYCQGGVIEQTKDGSHSNKYSPAGAWNSTSRGHFLRLVSLGFIFVSFSIFIFMLSR